MEQIRIIFYGGGGVAIDTARYILDINEQLSGKGSVLVSDVVDEQEGRFEDIQTMLGYRVETHRDITTVKDFEDKRVVIALGHTPLRHEKFVHLKSLGASFYSVIHPKSDIASTAKIGRSCIVAPYCVMSPFAVLQDNVLVNVRSTVSHDVIIGESSVLSPQVVMSGSVVCGKSVFAGAGVIVTPGAKIGDYTKLSAGCVVTGDMPSGHFAHGNPASAKRMFDENTGRSLFDTRDC